MAWHSGSQPPPPPPSPVIPEKYADLMYASGTALYFFLHTRAQVSFSHYA